MRTPPLFLVIIVVMMVGCPKPSSPPTTLPRDAGTERSGQEAHVHDGGSLARRQLEFQPFNGRALELIGDKDLDNHYATTVMVDVSELSLPFSCSGIIVHPRLVLTAGHCVCQWRKVPTSGNKHGTIIDNSNCAGRAKITAILHEATNHPEAPNLTFWDHAGTVKPHPELKITLDSQETVLTSRADLAVILLDKPVDLGVPLIPLADTEAQVGDLVVIAGYGNDPGLEKLFGNRYFRRGTIKLLKPHEGRGIYEPAGAYFNTSYRGGPCLRESDKNHRIAGVVGLGTDQEMSFTSIYPYRTWLRTELQHAAARPNVLQQP